MTGAPADFDEIAARDPHTFPQQLADIAARRWDLHAIIAAHPQAYPELRAWMAQVNPPASPSPYTAQPPYATQPQYASQQPYATAPPADAFRPQGSPRQGMGRWLGCCLIVAILFGIVLVVFFVGVLGAMDLSDDNAGTSTGSDEQIVQEQMAIYEAERTKFYELAAQLEGNPVAPLVTDVRGFRLLEKASAGEINKFQAERLAQEAQQLRETLQQRIEDAAARRGNSSGSVTEELVDAAGDGFIDIGWDAATSCTASERPNKTTVGCTSNDPLGVHILPEAKMFGELFSRMTVLHELAHLYQNADLDQREDLHDNSVAGALIEQGMFEGSSEKFADCYALTYLDEWTLSNDQGSVGYGYVCNEAERQAIREWAAELNFPMP